MNVTVTKNSLIKNEYMKLIRSIDSFYEGYKNYFCEFSYYLKKYDNISIIKKAEIMLDKKFDDIYNEMLNKMKKNVNEKRKSR